MPVPSEEDVYWMGRALEMAEAAAAHGEVPVGALVVRDGKLLGSGYNQPISARDPTAHAEIQAMREAASVVGNYRLVGTTLYVTLEPCVMCVGAMIHARVQRLVYGASEPKTGAVESRFRLLEEGQHNHRLEAEGGVLAERSAELLQGFFRERRRRPA
ncbi:MAG: tRNA adenosine(34) deaminase TadA [Ectothiorhodospiraceae bacterium]|nr:tRNA adenosine(34) deaminase TadA [Ectothiorhodospiraceae bacterium]MCH8505340.1 tRNA adenosine(34) deaminase TadA [Ectothiorhodospiraceae bacterium]